MNVYNAIRVATVTPLDNFGGIQIPSIPGSPSPTPSNPPGCGGC